MRGLAAILAALALCAPSVTAAAETRTWAVGIQTRDYTDPARRNWAGSGPRPEKTTIWYPAEGAAPVVKSDAADRFVRDATLPGAPMAPGVHPLIVISHGTGGSALGLQWLAVQLAAKGYIVAGVDHHGNTGAEPMPYPQGFLLWWERPRDLSVVLDRVLADPAFGPRIDRDRIGAAGFSLGGYTMMAIAGGRLDRPGYLKFCASPERDFTCGPQPEFRDAPARFAELEKTDPAVKASLAHAGDSYRDPRVKAVFAMAPVFGRGFPDETLAAIRLPVQVVVGAGDTTAPPPTNARRYAALIPGARLTELPGAVGHYDFAPECTPLGVKEVDICKEGAGVDRAAVHRRAGELALAFFRDALRGR